MRYAALLALAASQAVASAASAQSLPTVPTGPGTVMQMMFSLVMVVGVILLLAWAVRRLKVMPRGAGGAIELQAELAVGPRERVLLLKVGDRQALVGVGTSGLQSLTLLEQRVQLPAGEAVAAGDGVAQRLRAALGRGGSA